MSKRKQIMRYGDSELELIRSTFTDNWELLKTIRKVFLQFPLDALELALLQNIRSSTEVLGLLRKTFLPTIDPDAPIHQLVDLWMTIDVRGKTDEDLVKDVRARKNLIDYINQQLEFIETGKEGTITFAGFSKIDYPAKQYGMVYSNLITRNSLIQHVETMLQQLEVLAGNPGESVEEIKERLAKDSAK